MDTLNLGGRPVVVLPGTAFPERADVYVCDKCGGDVTKHFHPRQSHSWAPMGPETFICACGQRYLTGATEWDHLGDWERSKRAGDTLGLGLLLSAVSSIFGAVGYLILHFAFGPQRAAFVAAMALAVLPFVLMQVTLWPDVAASIWRTRVGTRKEGPR
jgi:hypothetical protein